MKTPRELLLSRHAAANDKLDVVREQVLAEPNPALRESEPPGAAGEAVPSFWRELIWPGPKAWAGLAAVWIAILALHFAARDPSPLLAEPAIATSLEVRVVWQRQQELRAELIGQAASAEAVVPPNHSPPGPRSERPVQTLTA